MRIIKLSKPCVNQDAINKVFGVLESGWLTQGPLVAEFEQNFKSYVGSQQALAVNSATSGLHIALLSCGIGAGDEVIVPAFTWVATANVVELCNAKPVFVDIDLNTLNTTTEAILAKVTPKTKAVIVVHLFGKPFDVAALRTKLPSNIRIIEDAACAAGATVNGQQCGTMGDIGVYSFHPRKSITTGEGGMVVTDNADLAHQMSMLRNHGQDTSYRENRPDFMYDCPVVGFNYRMTDIQAALGIEQLKEINDFIAYRSSLVQEYAKHLAGFKKITLPVELSMEKHSWQSYVIVTDTALRNIIMEQLHAYGIETRPGTHAVHVLKYYKDKYQLKETDLPFAYQALSSTIALPLHSNMQVDDVAYVSEKLIEVINAI